VNHVLRVATDGHDRASFTVLLSWIQHTMHVNITSRDSSAPYGRYIHTWKHVDREIQWFAWFYIIAARIYL